MECRILTRVLCIVPGASKLKTFDWWTLGCMAGSWEIGIQSDGCEPSKVFLKDIEMPIQLHRSVGKCDGVLKTRSSGRRQCLVYTNKMLHYPVVCLQNFTTGSACWQYNVCGGGIKLTCKCLMALIRQHYRQRTRILSWRKDNCRFAKFHEDLVGQTGDFNAEMSFEEA